MKLTCSQADLNANLSLASRAVPSRPSHPILANVLLVAKAQAQQVWLTGFDLNLGIRVTFPAQVEVGGSLTLPARLFNDIVSRLPAGDITLDDGREDKEEDDGVSKSLLTTLKAGSGEYEMHGMSAEEFPKLPEVKDGQTISLPVSALVDGFQGSLFAASTDETKQILMGVHLSLREDTLEFAATDGHRLAVVETACDDPEIDDLSVTIPGRTLRELERLLSSQPSDALKVHLQSGQMVFEWEGCCLTSRLLDGQYPNYKQLIPQKFVRQMTIERKVFLSSLERIAVLADQKNGVVKLNLDEEQQSLTISVEAQDVGKGQESLPAQISGESLEVAFNVRYLMDGLKAFNTSEVQMQLNKATSPSVLTPLGSVKMTYLVMPVQVRS